MALHRKQRGVVDAAPQYVRIPTSRASGRAVGYSLHETHQHAQRVITKRYAPGDRSRKISSLQLRACFVLCVLLYFGAIYFADDIASLGRVVGSEQNSQSFFVHSLRPRGRGHMRVGRAVDAKKAEATEASMLSTKVEDSTEEQQLQDDPATEVAEADTVPPEAEVIVTAETEEEAQATEPLGQPVTAVEAMHQVAHRAQDDVPGDAVHPDDQGEGAPTAPADDNNQTQNETDEPELKLATAHEGQAKLSESHLETRKPQQVILNASSVSKKQTASAQPHPTAALRHSEKEGGADAVPAASPARSEMHRVRSDVDLQTGRKPSNEQPAETTQPAKENLTEHISDI